MKKALILASVASMIDQFNMSNIKLLLDAGYEVHVAANFQHGNTTSLSRLVEFKGLLTSMNVNYFDIQFMRNAFSLKNINAYKQVKQLLHQNRYDIIHLHSPIGGVVGRLAARKFRQSGTKVIYTAHGFHFYKGAPILNWIIYYPIEWWLSKFTDLILTINSQDYDRAIKFKSCPVQRIPGIGIDTQSLIEENNLSDYIRRELNIPIDSIILLSVGELNKNKNHSTIIKAISNLNKDIYYVICGEGILKESLKSLAHDYGVEDRVIFSGYRTDIPAFLHSADIFIFPSFREGLSVSLMEAMAAGMPCIVSRIRGNTDLIIEGCGGYLCSPADHEGFSKAILQMITSREMKKMGEYNIKHIANFDVHIVMDKMKKVYEID